MKNRAINGSLLLIVGILFSSCSNKTRENLKLIDSFPITVELSGQPIPKIKNDFYPIQMGLEDSILIFCDVENSPHFHAYKVPGFIYMGSFGEKGRGPGELQNPSFWGQIQKNGSYKLWAYQMDLCNLILLDINKAIHEPGYEFEHRFEIPIGPGEAVNIIAINDSMFVGGGGDSKGEFFIYNNSQMKLAWKEFYVDPFIHQETNNLDIIAECKRGIIKIKPDRTMFAKALVYAPIINIYNSCGTLELSIMLSDFKRPDIKDNEIQGSTMVYYENIFLSDNYIYALNRNCSINDYSSANDVEIHVYSWDGKPICKYRLNEGIGPAAPFVVDEFNRKIYTVHPKSEIDFFSFFELGDELLFN